MENLYLFLIGVLTIIVTTTIQEFIKYKFDELKHKKPALTSDKRNKGENSKH